LLSAAIVAAVFVTFWRTVAIVVLLLYMLSGHSENEHVSRRARNVATASPITPEWRERLQFSGRGIKASHRFGVGEGMARIRWEITPDDNTWIVAVTIRDRINQYVTTTTCEGRTGESSLYVKPGTYHLDVNSFGAAYVLYVEELD
jgi:hypothetical protein